jgi:PKD repeat protein
MRRLLSTIRRPREASRHVGLRAGGAALAVSIVASLAITTSAAQAIVVNDAGTEAGVAIAPSARGASLPTGVSAVTSGSSCTDPWLATDLGGPSMPSAGLCYRGGAVMNKNETYALTWDQDRNYWSRTRGYVEQYLRDVADGSGSLGSPYALTPQYSDAGGKAQNASIFGGGCIDYGNVGGSACEFGNAGTAGHDFPANGCAPSGDSFVNVNLVAANDRCLTDAQLKGEVSTMVTQTGILSRTQPGYTPLVTLLLPPGLEDCLDASHNLCSTNGQLTPPPPAVSANTANGATIAPGNYGIEITYTTSGGETVASSAQTVTATGTDSTITISSPPPAPGATGWYAYVTQPNGVTYMRQGSTPNTIGTDVTLATPPTGGPTPPNVPSFCSYHSQVNVGGTEVAYVVQPWTAGTNCDEPGIPDIPQDPTEEQLALAVGARLVSPLSESHIASIVNPGFDGWAALNGSETEDNGGCTPLPRALDQVTVGNSSQNPYYLQREFNNAGVLEFDPVTYYGCAPVNTFEPSFVAPSAVDQSDEVQFDGSSTASTLMVPNAGYAWNFGDGGTATGPSVVHSFAKGGIYTVTLTVTDRGGDKGTSTQSIVVLGAAGQNPTPPTTQQPGGGHSAAPAPAFQVHLQLSPQSLKSVLRNGIALQVHSNKVANGILTVSISRAEAKRAHIKVGRGSSVVIARGTTSAVKNGVSHLLLHLPRKVAAKLKKLRHATFSVRLSLVASGGGHLGIDAAGKY